MKPRENVKQHKLSAPVGGFGGYKSLCCIYVQGLAGKVVLVLELSAASLPREALPRWTNRNPSGFPLKIKQVVDFHSASELCCLLNTLVSLHETKLGAS